MIAASKRSVLETETCSRCGGSGQYSYCQMYGTRCFRCAGSGKTYTKRGAAARSFLEASLSLPAHEIRPGMKISVTVITNGGQLAGNKFSEVLAVWRDIADRSVTIETKDLMMLRCDPLRLERFAATAEQKSIAQAKALEFQASLTKAGTVRLRSK